LLHGLYIVVVDKYEPSLGDQRLLAKGVQVVAGISIPIPAERISLDALVPLGVVDRQAEYA
jgi:hypothetical protein